MTYFSFLLLFIVGPSIVLALLTYFRVRTLSQQDIWKWITVVGAIAFVYTTPWDNYLVYKRVWYYGIERVMGTIGYVPIEEYLFFLLQPVLTGLATAVCLDTYMSSSSLDANREPPPLWKPGLTAAWLACSASGAILLWASSINAHYTYLGLILAWACPVLAGMSWISAPTFWAYRRPITLAISLPTLYLWVADRFAIGQGIWDISNDYSLDFDPLGLPVEEAVFFLVTNVLVVQGLVMFLPLNKQHAITE